MADLITLDEYKIYAGIESEKHDDKLTRLITSVSQMVKTYCANSFVDYVSASTPKVETFTLPWEANIVQLSESPVIDVVTVEERISYGDGYTTLDDAAFEYYLDEATECLYRTNEIGFLKWPAGPGSVRVTYNAGYDALPDDLRLAVYDIVTYYFKEEYKERRTIGTASMANQTSSTQWRNVGFPDHIKRVLDLYKHIRV